MLVFVRGFFICLILLVLYQYFITAAYKDQREILAESGNHSMQLLRELVVSDLELFQRQLEISFVAPCNLGQKHLTLLNEDVLRIQLVQV